MPRACWKSNFLCNYKFDIDTLHYTNVRFTPSSQAISLEPFFMLNWNSFKSFIYSNIYIPSVIKLNRLLYYSSYLIYSLPFVLIMIAALDNLYSNVNDNLVSYADHCISNFGKWIYLEGKFNQFKMMVLDVFWSNIKQVFYSKWTGKLVHIMYSRIFFTLLHLFHRNVVHNEGKVMQKTCFNRVKHEKDGDLTEKGYFTVPEHMNEIGKSFIEDEQYDEEICDISWSACYDLFSSGVKGHNWLSTRILRGVNLIMQFIFVLAKATKLLMMLLPFCILLPSLYASRMNNTIYGIINDCCWKYFFWTVENSGPTQIKFLQWAATRTDLFPYSFCLKCSRFQCSVKRHAYPYTELSLIKHFGAEWKSFLWIDPVPVGSGCVAQVYYGILNPYSSPKEVAVKICHPHVRSNINTDILLMRVIAYALEFFPSMKWLALRDSVSEFSRLMKRQVDMRIEARNLKKFNENFINDEASKKNFKKKNGRVLFPVVIDQLCSSEILMESFEDGIPLSQWFYRNNNVESDKNCKSDDDMQLRRNIGEVGLQVFLKMLFVDNFIHGDLHPGNILLRFPTNNQLSFEMILLDCGLTIEMDLKDRRNFVELFRYITMGHGKEAGKLLLERSRRNQCKHQDEFCSEVSHLVCNYHSESRGSLVLGKAKIGEILSKLLSTSCKFKVELDPSFLSVLLAVIIVEGVGRQLNPDADILKTSLPYVTAAAASLMR